MKYPGSKSGKRYLQDYGPDAPPLGDFGIANISFFRALESMLVQSLFMNPSNQEVVETLAEVKDCIDMVESGTRLYCRFHSGKWYFAVRSCPQYRA